MKKFGLIGYPLEHSFSKKYFEKKIKNEKLDNVRYDNYEIDNFNKLIDIIDENPELLGLNVTIPYKEKIISLLDGLDETAKKIGSVNTIKIIDGKLIGFNTDHSGFKHSLLNWKVPIKNISALILGTGGSSKAIKYTLNELNIPYKLISRESSKTKISYEELFNQELLNNHKLIINTTPIGMYPNINNYPKLNYDQINNEHFVFDLVYNPSKTKLLSLCENRGAKIKNGHEMLINQAELSWDLWNK
tara:strand:- start:887 stop:1624 length:738 start_codon:yes stop_codon:yes gene_type:complete